MWKPLRGVDLIDCHVAALLAMTTGEALRGVVLVSNTNSYSIKIKVDYFG